MKRRVAAGRLHPRFRGVFAVGHSGLSRLGEWLAAVDACGPHAVLSHLAAACLWKLLDWNENWPIDVTIAGSSGRQPKPGIRIHHSLTLLRRDIGERSAIPVTIVPRLIADVRRTADPRIYRRVLREAEYQGYRKGLPEGYVPTRSEFEHLVLRFCTRHGLPSPRTRVKVGPYEADFLFPDEGLFVEADSWSAHRGRVAFETDHQRDLYLMARGYEVLRLTWLQVTADPEGTARDLDTILTRLAARP